MDVWSVVAAVAALQHGLVARWQLRCLGLSSEAIQRRLDQHGWRRLYPGVYALPGVRASARRRAAAALLAYSQPTLAPGRVEAQLAAGVPLVDALVSAAFGPWAVLTGPTAAHLLGLLPAEPKRVHVLLQPGQSRVPLRGVALTSAPLRHDERNELDRLPIVVAVRAIADIAALGGEWLTTVITVIAAADAARGPSLDDIDTASAKRGVFKGKRLLTRAVLELRGGLSHSKTEAWARRKVAQIAQRYGLTVHERPYPIRCNGRIVGEADIAVLEVRYDLEIDGPHHLLPEQVARDKRRDRRVGSAGWTIDRYLITEIEAAPREFLAAVDNRLRDLAAQMRASRR